MAGKRRLAALEKQVYKNSKIENEVDDFYKEDELVKEEGYEMESIIPEEKELPTPHFDDKTFEIINENETNNEIDLPEIKPIDEKYLEMELVEKPVEDTNAIELENPTLTKEKTLLKKIILIWKLKSCRHSALQTRLIC